MIWFEKPAPYFEKVFFYQSFLVTIVSCFGGLLSNYASLVEVISIQNFGLFLNFPALTAGSEKQCAEVSARAPKPGPDFWL